MKVAADIPDIYRYILLFTESLKKQLIKTIKQQLLKEAELIINISKPIQQIFPGHHIPESLKGILKTENSKRTDQV